MAKFGMIFISKNILLLGVLIFSICFSNNVEAQGQFTNRGKDFLLAFASNNGRDVTLTDLEIKIVTNKETQVKITFNHDGSEVNFAIPANTVRAYLFNDTEAAKIYSLANGIDKRSIRVETNHDVTIYALNLSVNTTDATAVLPINNYGKEYINVGIASSGCMIIATEDNTILNIEGVASNVLLQKFQVYRNSFSSVGKRITTNGKNVAAFNFHSCSSSPCGACDHQWEQLVPVANYGKEFFIPFIGFTCEEINVVATNSNTNLTITIGSATPFTATINPGTAYTINSSQFIADVYMSSDQQVGVTAHIGGKYSTYEGDPATAWVPPIEQNITSAYIAAFETSKSAIRNHFILVVAKKEDKGGTTINGIVQTGWKDHKSGYSSVNYMIPNKTIPYEVLNPKGVVVTAFGTGSYESYFYLAASSARKLDASFTINGVHYQDANLSVPFDCGTPFNFAATIQYELHASAGRIKWYVDGVEEVSARDQLTWTKPYLSGGNHTLKLVVKDSYGEDEEMETTLKVECATDMTPKVAAIYEGDQVKITIALGAGNAPVAMVFALSAAVGTTAVSGDYSFPSSVTIPAGQNKVEFYVQATSDNIINEPDVLLKLKASTNGYPDLLSDITIKDKVTAANKALSLTALPLAINEPHTGQTTTPNSTAFTVSLPSPITTKTTIRVNLGYAGTGTMDADYTLSIATAKTYVDIPANGSSASFTLTAKEDNLYEEKEMVAITPTAQSGYTMSTGPVTIEIADKTPSDIVVATLLNAEESATTPVTGKFQIRFKKTEVTTKKQIKVVYKLTGTANDGTVYDLISPTEAIIPLDKNYVDVEIKPKNNFVVEGARKVEIELLSVASI